MQESKIKIGCDIHGVISQYPSLFKDLSRKWTENGHEIHIITGQEWDKVKHKVSAAGIVYSNHFSIVDYHLALKDVETWRDSKNTVWMAEEIWNSSKGQYAYREHIDIHFDDNYQYFKWMPEFTTCVLVPKTGFDRFDKALLML